MGIICLGRGGAYSFCIFYAEILLELALLNRPAVESLTVLALCPLARSKNFYLSFRKIAYLPED